MNKRDIVTVVCYGQSERMTREKAIKKFKTVIMCSEGSEQERYARILSLLLDGEKVCSDKL